MSLEAYVTHMTLTSGAEHITKYQSAPSVCTAVSTPVVDRSIRVVWGGSPDDMGRISLQLAGDRAGCSGAENAGRPASGSSCAAALGVVAASRARPKVLINILPLSLNP